IYNKAGPQTYGTFIKISQEFNNTASYEIQRNSSEAGALAFDLNRTLSSGYIYTLDLSSSDPYSWVWGSGYGGEMVGIVNLEENGTSNYFSVNSTSYGRIGIQLNQTSIPSSSIIREISLVYFAATGGSDAVSEFLSIKDRFANPVNITQFLPERWYVAISPSTNATIYNRNETILVKGNVSSGDPYNLTKYMNATFDMGTSSPADDQTLILYDDGTNGDEIADDKIFTNIFNIPNDASVGTWKINFTAYTENLEFLNFTIHEFNVTDVLNVSVNITNKKPMVGSTVIANLYVKNFRQDSWISGATINCTYDSNEVTNKIDYNNGTYSVNFTAPYEEGTFVLACNATKNGNFGNASDEFTTEPGKSNISITVQPSNPFVYNISLYRNDSFVIITNASNFGNGTAYSTNITLELLESWQANSTKEECSDINKNEFCVKGFNITVPNSTAPGNYYINVTATWKNPDQTISSNKTQVNVTVQPNPIVDVEETEVSGEAGDGIWTLVGNFTVLSVGNDALHNISFSCISGDVCSNFEVEFIPSNISSLAAGAEHNVTLNITVPLAYPPGKYNGTINVSAQNDGFDTFVLEVRVPSKTNVSITTNISSYTANNITQQNNETFYFNANSLNTGNGSARYVNISVSVLPGWLANPSLEYCGNLIKNQTCSKDFNVTIPKATSPGNYFVNVSVNWTNPDGSPGTNKTQITVTVASNPLIDVSEEKVSGIAIDGAESTVGNFTVLSVGNDALQNINFNCSSGIVCSNFTVEFIPSSISNLAANSNQSVMINVSVPLSFPFGTYNGTINVSAQNDGFDTFVLEVSVPENRT
ncbi:MAG: NEW3 domain-containing protein, partial [Fervidobacterium sp.]